LGRTRAARGPVQNGGSSWMMPANSHLPHSMM
jgi:hypothetical protein